MREEAAQVVLLVRAFEESDGSGIVVTPYTRAAATRRALRVTGLADWPEELSDGIGFRYTETVLRRARQLYELLYRRLPVLASVLRIARLGAGTGPAVLALALLLGLATNILGPQRQINLLSFPLIGIVSWNLVIYLLTAISAVGNLSRARRNAEGIGAFEPGTSKLAAMFLKGAVWRRLHGRRIRHGGTPEQRRTVAKAIVRFGALWHRLAGRLLAARVRRTLHLAAVAVVLGALGGMYVRGLAFAYEATWESTLLDSDTAQRFLDLLLGPAAALLGTSVPDVVPLRGPGRSGDAAIWIHLYAVTAVLYVVLPRTLLALYQGWRCRRLADVRIDLRDGYFRRVFTEWRGGARTAEVLPYSYRPDPSAASKLKTLLHQYFGARADVVLHEPLEYGADCRIDSLRATGDAWAPRIDSDKTLADVERETSYIVVFNLAQPPEVEVHGAFLGSLRDRIEGTGRRVLVLADEASYRERVDAERLTERRRAWQQVAASAELELIAFDAAREIDDELIARVRAALWPQLRVESLA